MAILQPCLLKLPRHQFARYSNLWILYEMWLVIFVKLHQSLRFLDLSDQVLNRNFADDINKIAGIIKDFSFVGKVNEFALSKKIVLNESFNFFI